MAHAPVQLINPRRYGDTRGWFTEFYSVPAFEALGIACTFGRDNTLAVLARRHAARPRGQDKLVNGVCERIYHLAKLIDMEF